MNVENISRFKKERFLRSLSEDEFRDRVVRPLFLRSGFTDGRDLCGPNEHGKDAIFIDIDQLGFKSITALQTKKGHLNLAAKAASNLIEATTQLKTALDSSITITATREKRRPNRVILCASGKINDAAKQHILDEVKNPNIQFMDVDDLIPKLDKILPELWLGIEADILPYYQAIECFVIGNSPTKDYALGADGILDGAASDDSFITLNLHRSTTKKKKVHGTFVDTPQFEELPLTSVISKKTRKIIIAGEAGSGKSTGLMRIALEAARRGLKEDENYKIPILLKALDIAHSKLEDLVSYCDVATRTLSQTKKSCFTLDDLSRGKVILLIDALDEIANDSERQFVASLITHFSNTYPKCQVILTTRPYRFISEISDLRSFEEYRISPINWKQAEKIVTAVVAQRKLPKSQSQEFLRKLEKIHGIELNPLLVTVFAATSDFSKQDIPANITELFKKFTELMLGRWDEKKGLKQQYMAPLKDFVLTKIAFHLHREKRLSMQRVEAESIGRHELETRGHKADVEKMLTEVFDRSGLFRVNGTELEFRHLLLQEFFAGRGIESLDFIKVVATDEWWQRALIFYFGENPGKIDSLKEVHEAIRIAEPAKLFQGSVAVGLALQACYLSPVSEKIDVWKSVVTALSTTLESWIKQIDDAEKYPLSNFTHAYLYARDAVALSHLKPMVKELLEWAESPHTMDSSQKDESAIFWIIVGLIESGDIEEAEQLLRTFSPSDTRLLMVIHLGCHLAHEIRPLPDSTRKRAKYICTLLNEKVAPYIQQITKEFGSALLEIREGKMSIADDL